ncbi:MAG: hypothetical protein AAF125_09270, partial [Chloroflexota bacterium]
MQATFPVTAQNPYIGFAQVAFQVRYTLYTGGIHRFVDMGATYYPVEQAHLELRLEPTFSEAQGGPYREFDTATFDSALATVHQTTRCPGGVLSFHQGLVHVV